MPCNLWQSTFENLEDCSGNNLESEELQEFDQHFRPLIKITPELYKSNSLDQRNKDMKLNWAIRNINQDFCQAFRETYDSNGFSAVKEAVKQASDIYANHR